MSGLAEDAERLVAIAERVLAGEPIESFDLGEYEIFVVTGYTSRSAGLVGGSGIDTRYEAAGGEQDG